MELFEPMPPREKGKRSFRFFVAVCLAAGVLATAGGCSRSSEKSDAGKTVEDQQRKCAYTVPPGWLTLDGEARSRGGTLFTIHVYELEGADPSFVQGLPDTVLPKIDDWAQHFFRVEGKPGRSNATVGGEPALVMTYSTRVRAQDPPSTLSHWIVRKGTRLFVLRTAYAPATREKDAPDVQAIVDSFKFLEGASS
jgi:hypothetical protein